MTDNSYVIEDKIVNDYHKKLMSDKQKLEYICKLRGLKVDTIKRFKIGYHNYRYTIPIKSVMDQYVNIRMWTNKQEPKIKSYGKGYGENRLFPLNRVKHEKKATIIINEGEWDSILLSQHGFYCITPTCGVGSWKDEWCNYLVNKNVVILFDCDDAGRTAALKTAEKLSTYARTIKIVDMGLDDKEDVTDWFVKYGKSKEELAKLIKNTDNYDIHKMIDISESMKPDCFDKKIKFNGLVIGKDLAPYLIPKLVTATCPGCDGKKSALCALGDTNKATMMYDYEANKGSLIKMVNASDTQINGIIRRDMGLPSGRECHRVHIQVKERQSIEDVSIIPEITTELIDAKEHVTRRAFIFNDTIQANQGYVFKGTTWADPSNQKGINLINENKPIKDSIHKFVIDEEVKSTLMVFRPDDVTSVKSIWKKLKDVYMDFTYNVTHIYNRTAIIMATDLIYHSALSFDFLGRRIHKGWLECAIIGDTRTGKTETVRNMVKHNSAGEFLTSGENTTRSGILGGAQQQNNRWMLTWGKIPLNDGGLLAVDEADNLTEMGIMGKLSGVRSSGIAEVVAIQTQKTTARTRLIWIANPIKGRVSEHNYGVNTIKQIFEKQQDISRLDFAIIVGKDEVDESIINKVHMEKYKHKYTSDLCHARVMWAWNLRPEQIKWAKGAEKLVLDVASTLGKKYVPNIPLIIDAEARIKIARMSVALAVCTFSTDESMENVIVHQAHVHVVCEYLQKLYDSHVMGYLDFSEQTKKTQVIEHKEELDAIFTTTKAVEMILELNYISLNDIEDIFMKSKDGAKELIQILRQNRAIMKHNWYYRKTPNFIEYLKKRKRKLSTDFTVVDNDIL